MLSATGLPDLPDYGSSYSDRTPLRPTEAQREREVPNIIKDLCSLALPVTIPAIAIGLYAYRSKGWTVLSLSALTALQVQISVSMNTRKGVRENVHEGVMKVALGVFIVFWFTYVLNSDSHWAQDDMLIPTLMFMALCYRQLYEGAVKIHGLLVQPTFKALNSWCGKMIQAEQTQSYFELLKANGIVSCGLRQLFWGSISGGLLGWGYFLPKPDKYLTELPGYLLAAKTITSPLSLAFATAIQHQKQRIDFAFRQGGTHAPILNRAVKVMIPVVGALEVVGDIAAAGVFVYALKQSASLNSAYQWAIIPGALLAWKSVHTWQLLKHRTTTPVDESYEWRAKRIAWVCTAFFGIAIPAYTITQAIRYGDPNTIGTAINICVSSFASYLLSKGIQKKWTPESGQILRWCRFYFNENPALWAYLVAACNHARKVPNIPFGIVWEQLGWFAQAMLFGLNIADIDDFLHDPQKWQEPRLDPLTIMNYMAWIAEIPEVFQSQTAKEVISHAMHPFK